MKVLVTGSNGFIGKNLCVALSSRNDIEFFGYEGDSPREDLEKALGQVDILFHLAGVNRPQNLEDFEIGNAGFTRDICFSLISQGRSPKIILSSSIQAALENPYGRSKRGAEEAVRSYCQKTGATGVIYRLKNIFGKWCRPNYNSVTATFCQNIAHNLPIQISDPQNVLDLTYIDDVVEAFLAELAGAGTEPGGFRFAEPLPSHQITLGELARLIQSFHDHRQTLLLPDLSNRFIQALYATYLSYLEPGDFAYSLDIKQDNRGALAEFIKAPTSGQIFISRTRPGITRGDHYHDTKTEKFLVLEGEAVISLRAIGSSQVVEFTVQGNEFRVVDIPPGYAHTITNVGNGELVTLFWASQVFDPAHPDTYPLQVERKS